MSSAHKSKVAWISILDAIAGCVTCKCNLQNVEYLLQFLADKDTCSQPGGAWVYEPRISSFVFLNEYYAASFQTWQKRYSKREI